MTGRPRRCSVRENDQRCTEIGIYLTWLDDCIDCQETLGVLFCVGHYACVPHAADLRAGNAGTKVRGDGSDFVVTRMTGLTEAA